MSNNGNNDSLSLALSESVWTDPPTERETQHMALVAESTLAAETDGAWFVPAPRHWLMSLFDNLPIDTIDTKGGK